MKRYNVLYLITFILAFCSIVYELVLAQSLAAFLGNTVLRYSITIGLYMFSMGIGALLAEGRLAKHPILSLLRVEILLTVIGGFAVIFLHVMDILDFSRLLFSIFAHTLIIVIGILTGFEIPLLIAIRKEGQDHPENSILAVDYVGAFVGTLAFAFCFYPQLGLMTTAFSVGFLNAFAGLLLISQRGKETVEIEKPFYSLLCLQAFWLTVIGSCLIFSPEISHYFIQSYLM